MAVIHLPIDLGDLELRAGVKLRIDECPLGGRK
jgi:hypothetical protein